MADNLFQELLRRATTPLVPKIKEGYDQLANLVDDPNGSSSNVPLETFKGFTAGALQGVGDVAADMTSPLGIASTALGAAAAPRGIKAVARMKPKLYPNPDLLDNVKLPPDFTPVGAEPPSRWATEWAMKGGPEAGFMPSDKAIKLGLAGGAAAYGIPKLMKTMRNLNKRINPFQKYADTVTPE